MGPRLTDDNRLSIVNSNLSKEWDYNLNFPLKPSDVFYGSSKKYYWICFKCNSSYLTSPKHRTHGTGCPYCSGKQVNESNSLASLGLDVLEEWHPTKNGELTPSNTTKGSNKKVWWICKNGHEWKTSIANRVIVGHGCPYCSNQKTSKDNCLLMSNPAVAHEWHPTKNGELTARDVVYGSTKKVWWICKKGHEWETTVSHRKRGNNCPYCSNKKVSKGNCLLATNPLLAQEWNFTKNNKLTPIDVVSGSHKKVWWLCSECGNEWESTIDNRNRGNGCPKCYFFVILKDGECCSSVPEAYLYLQYKKQGLKFKHDKKYGSGMGRCRYDFYFPDTNKYVEVTSFHKNYKRYYSYLRNIVKKRRYVEAKNANFEFIQFVPSKKDIDFVRKHSRRLKIK